MQDYSSIKYANLNSPPELKVRQVWFGIYEGIRFEINKFRFGPNDEQDRWAHYIFISLDDQLTKENADKFWLPPEYIKFSENGNENLSYRYWDTIINEIEFHGGCTFYKKISSIDDKKRTVQIGCDYQHAWDDGKIYELNYVYNEVQKSIDSLLKLVGPIKIGSGGDGKYRFIEEFSK